MTLKTRQHYRDEQGYTLVEVAIGIVIVGMLISYSAVAYFGAIKFNLEKKTHQRMEHIADAISIYAQLHMRIPCPADPNPATAGGEPYGTEYGSGGNGLNFGTCNTNATNDGIIPFATLGLSQNEARDHFGNFFTYAISYTSTIAPATSATLRINSWCMTSPWWYNGTNFVAAAKGAFCCGTWNQGGGTDTRPTTDIQIWDYTDTPLQDLARTSYVDNDGNTISTGSVQAEYRTTGMPPPTLGNLTNNGAGSTTTLPPRFPAYILISHGRNGFGAFLDTGGKIPGAADAEAENSDGDRNYYATNNVSPNATGAGNTSLFQRSIDDIVYWETPAQIIGRIGGGSCHRP